MHTTMLEIKTKTEMKFPVLRNRKDNHVDLHDLLPCWLTHEWRAA